MALQGSGSISIVDIQTEVGITPSSAVSVAGASAPTQAGTLFGEATGTINKTAPHSISEFYGYNQVDDFILSLNNYASGELACADTDIGATKWWEGDSATPQVGDIIWNEGTSTSKFNGGGDWYRIPAEDKVLRISSVGVVLEKEDCNQTLAISTQQETWDNAVHTFNVDVVSNTTWTLSSPATWISLNGTPVNGSGNDTVSVSITANSGAERDGVINGVYGLGTQQITITQLATAYVNLMVGSDVVAPYSSAVACGATPFLSKSDSTDLSTATILLNSFGTAFAPEGYYSDGVLWRYWTGTDFTTSDFC